MQKIKKNISSPLVKIENLGVTFAHKICFQGFNNEILNHQKIGIIGNNGSGKSTLLKIIANIDENFEGTLKYNNTISTAYIPQLINEDNHESGGQTFIKKLIQTTQNPPEILLLDEPTNHLDEKHTTYLFRLIKNYPKTVLIASHDQILLNNYIDILWHIHDHKIHIHTGNYNDYLISITQQHNQLKKELARIDYHKQALHQQLIKEQQRASKRKAYGEKKYHGDKLALRAAQAKGQKTHNQNCSKISIQKINLIEKQTALYEPKVIIPKFSIISSHIHQNTQIQIVNGALGYTTHQTVLSNINFILLGNQRIAIVGKNGSGKSSFLKAILKNNSLFTTGDWRVPKYENIGYLDQKYQNLKPKQTVLESFITLKPEWSHQDIRKHLNTFLFCKTEEVNLSISKLSGGEKARLSLAHIAAKTPPLLLLDEITNNLDLETKAHVIQVLNAYPGAILLISHDKTFLSSIRIDTYYTIHKHSLLSLQSP